MQRNKIAGLDSAITDDVQRLEVQKELLATKEGTT